MNSEHVFDLFFALKMTTLVYLTVPMDVGMAKRRGDGRIRLKKLKLPSN